MDTIVEELVVRQHTPEQEAILDFAATSKRNGMVQAYAGTGKTTILEEIGIAAAPELFPIDDATEGKTIQYLVFGAKNAKEAVERMPACMDCRTINSLGHRAFSKSQGARLTVDKDKVHKIFRQMIAEEKGRGEIERMWSIFSEVTQGVAMAKSVGYVPEGKYPMAKRLCAVGAFHNLLDEVPEDDTADYIDAVLIKSIRQAYNGLIDFNDQVYMPALFGGTFERYPLTLVDEYQDLSPVNHALLERCIKGRLIGVGDRYQNIYGFRGAKAAGMDDAVVQYDMEVLPLSVSFRCPSAVVQHVRWHVPKFQWHKEGGSVTLATKLKAEGIVDDTTIICRNNAPLLACAFRLLSSGRAVSVVGVDIGPKLIAIMRKFGPDTLTREQVYTSIDNWLESKLERESKTAPDMAECMRVFAAMGKELGQALIYAEDIFKRQGPITLTTGHKSKGLEYDNVIHIDPHLVRANSTGRPASDQDRNLDYVISTRSKNLLTEVASEQIEW